MFPEPLFHILGEGINVYFIMAVLAAFTCLLVAVRFALKVFPEKSPAPLVRSTINVFAVAILAGLAGARIFCFLGQALETPWLLKTFSLATLFSGCIASLGGIMAAIAALWIYVNLFAVTRDRPGPALDVFFPPLVLFQAMFRIGCFSAGCCHGRPAYDLPWAVTFTHPHTACVFAGLPVHPTQLYMVAGNLAIFFLLLTLFGRPLFQGRLAGVYLLSYGMLRFFVEFYRGDPRPMLGVLSLNQWTCLVFILVGGIILARRFWDRAKTPAIAASGRPGERRRP